MSEEIIRCKDCKYYHNLKGGAMFYADDDIVHHYGHCEFFEADDYCSKAKISDVYLKEKDYIKKILGGNDESN